MFGLDDFIVFNAFEDMREEQEKRDRECSSNNSYESMFGSDDRDSYSSWDDEETNDEY